MCLKTTILNFYPNTKVDVKKQIVTVSVSSGIFGFGFGNLLHIQRKYVPVVLPVDKSPVELLRDAFLRLWVNVDGLSLNCRFTGLLRLHAAHTALTGDDLTLTTKDVLFIPHQRVTNLRDSKVNISAIPLVDKDDPLHGQVKFVLTNSPWCEGELILNEAVRDTTVEFKIKDTLDLLFDSPF